ncbi:MAG: T9SS type A sorting domain-containing protein [Calditrichaeota bacterium]|nr:T9SS type A sorting domain-containing protein [Calditrichota bacterium]
MKMTVNYFALLIVLLLSFQCNAELTLEPEWQLDFEQPVLSILDHWMDRDGNTNFAIVSSDDVDRRIRYSFDVVSEGELVWEAPFHFWNCFGKHVQIGEDESVLLISTCNWWDGAMYKFSAEDFSPLDTFRFEIPSDTGDFNIYPYPSHSITLTPHPEIEENDEPLILFSTSRFRHEYGFGFSDVFYLEGTYGKLSLTNGTIDSTRIRYAPIETVAKDWNNDGVEEFLVFGYESCFEIGGIPFRDQDYGYFLNIMDANLNIIEQFDIAEDNHIWRTWMGAGYQNYSHMCLLDSDNDGEDEIYIMISSSDGFSIYGFSFRDMEVINSLSVESENQGKTFEPVYLSGNEEEPNSILIVDGESNIWIYYPLENEIIQVEGNFEPHINDLIVGNFDNDPAMEIAMTTADGFALYEILSLDAPVENSAPIDYNIVGVYPNPFNSTTTISFSLHMRSRVNLQIYNTQGQLVDVLLDRVVSGGKHSALWDAKGVGTGLYFAKLNVGGEVFTQKVILVK